MAESLFLVENSEKAEIIKLIAGDRIEVVVLEECPASYSIRPQGQSGASVFSFQPIASVWSSVLERIANYADVYYCFDSSMDGEYVSYLVDQLLLTSSTNVLGHRLSLAGFTTDLLNESLSLVEPIAEARCVRHLQHNLFQKVFFSHLSRLLGTIQGPGHVELSIANLALFSMLAEKDESLARVVRQHKWEVEVRVQQDGQECSGRLTEMYGISSDGFLDSGEQAKEVAETIKGAEFTLVDRSDNELRLPCPSLYTLPDLVVDAYRFHQIMPGDVLSGLQELFTGVDIGQSKVGLISSPYGVSRQNMQPVFRGLCQFVTETYGENAQVKKEFGDDVILPLDPRVQPAEVQLPPILKQLYDLIWSRSVASQMVDALGSDKKIMFEAEGKRIQFTSLTSVQQGFLAVFNHGYESVFTESSATLFQGGDSLVVSAALVQQVKPQGVAHYQISSLCEDMREMGFDDEKQILLVLQQMLDHGYVLLSGAGEILCKNTLLKVTATIDRAFPGMKGPNLPAYYGQTLDELMSGRKRVDVALKQFDQNLVMQGKPLVKVKIPVSLPKRTRKSKNVIKGGEGAVQAVGSMTEGFKDFSEDALAPPDPEGGDELVDVPSPEVDVVDDAETIAPDVVQEACDVDEPAELEVADLQEAPVEEVARGEPEMAPEPAPILEDSPSEDVFDQPLAPAVEVVVEAEVAIDPVDLATVETKDCPECGRLMVVKDDRFGKFWSCTGMPACHHSETYQKKDAAEPLLSCPVCKRGALSVNRTPAGKDMYICNDPACGFMAWSKPHAIDCPLCGSPFLIQKKDRMGNASLRCPMAGCSYVHGGLADDASPVKPKKKMVRVRRKKSGATGGKKKRLVRRKKT